MEYTHLGRAGLLVSRLCLGTVNFGWKTAEDEAFAIMDEAHELGINFFDTADSYGGSLGKGGTESLIGRWLAQGGGRRERTVLGSKVFNSFSDWPNDGKLSAFHIRRACEASLRRLQTDRIDLYQMHYYDPATPWDEIWAAMQVLHAQGKVLYFGVSNFAGWQVVTAHEAARRRGLSGIVSDQSEYNLLARDIERELIPACVAHGIGITAWSPLRGGILGGVPGTGAARTGAAGDRRNSEKSVALLTKHSDQIKAYESLCLDLGAEPATVALAWLLGRPPVTAAVVGPRVVAQLRQVGLAPSYGLPSEVTGALEEIFPGPGAA